MPGGLGSFRILFQDLEPLQVGTVSQHLGGLRQSATDIEKFSGSITQHIGGLRQIASGFEGVAGSITTRLRGLGQSMAGGLAGTGSQSVTTAQASPSSTTSMAA